MSRQKKTIAERALEEFKDNIRQSWTYERLTEEERAEVERIFHTVGMVKVLRGDYERCYEQITMIYRAYLYGLGYKRNGGGLHWRETAKA